MYCWEYNLANYYCIKISVDFRRLTTRIVNMIIAVKFAINAKRSYIYLIIGLQNNSAAFRSVKTQNRTNATCTQFHVYHFRITLNFQFQNQIPWHHTHNFRFQFTTSHPKTPRHQPLLRNMDFCLPSLNENSITKRLGINDCAVFVYFSCL